MWAGNRLLLIFEDFRLEFSRLSTKLSELIALRQFYANSYRLGFGLRMMFCQSLFGYLSAAAMRLHPLPGVLTRPFNLYPNFDPT